MTGILSMLSGGTYSTKPDAPTIGTATATSTTTATVSFTAPARDGGVAITSYTATSSPSGITGTLSQAGSGTITVSGLTTGTSYTFTVTATNSVGTSAASAASNSITTYLAPSNSVAPVVSGTATNGQTLSTTTGTWTGVPTPTFTYQWQRAGSNIGGATSSTYTLVDADVGNAIRCVVTATNVVAAVSANSNATASVAGIVPGAPTIGTVTLSGTTASVPFTQPASNGGLTITTYTATSSTGGLTGTLSQSGSGTITVAGLTPGVNYTFTVTATNSAGTGPASAASNSVSPPVIGQQAYTTSGSYTWVAPAGVTSVSVVAVGGGGNSTYYGAGGGGGLGWKNNITVVPGNPYSVEAGAQRANSYFISNETVSGRHGYSGTAGQFWEKGGGYAGDGGGFGGDAGYRINERSAYGGGGAGGYTGAGGEGAYTSSVPPYIHQPQGAAGTGGSAGGGGGTTWGGGGGGGVGILGQGAPGGQSGTGTGGGNPGGTNYSGYGRGGSGGEDGGQSNTSYDCYGAPYNVTYGKGGAFGGGVGTANTTAGRGAVRIIWPGTSRSFPSTNTGDL